MERTVEQLVDQQVIDKPLDGNHGEIHPKKSEFTASGIPFIMASDLVEGLVNQETCNFISREQADSLRKGFARDGDVLLSHKGTIGRSAILHTSLDYLVLTPQVTYYRILDKSVLDNHFLYYFFHSPQFQREIGNIAGAGSTRAYIGITKQLELHVLLPPLPEQKRIVAILDEAFTGIATAVANTEKNLANARELFESYLNNVFTRKGDGWIEKKIGDVCVLKSGTTVSKDLEISSGEVPYLKVADMNHAGNEIEIVGSSRFLNKSDLGRNAIFPIGTTIFPKRGGAILTNKKRLTAVPICTDLNIMGVIPSGALVPKFLYFYFLNVDMRKLGSGSSIPQINNYDIEPLAISFPQVIAEQKEIAKTLEELSSETHRLQALYQHKLTTLADLKQSLLHKAFSGALTSQSVSALQEAVA